MHRMRRTHFPAGLCCPWTVQRYSPRGTGFLSKTVHMACEHRTNEAAALPKASKQTLSGWGNLTFEEASLWRPESEGDLRAMLAGTKTTFIPRGLGRSYGDSAVHSDVILNERLNRLLHFEPATGVLECEAGVSLAKIIDVFLPRGFFLPVTPGTKFVTVGGALAADVHGKNHHRDGSFAEFVEDFRLLTGTGETLRCSRAENSSAFWATVGGMGLTGEILTARIRLMPVPSAYLNVIYHRTPSLQEALQAFERDDEHYRYSVAWLDCLARGRFLGRGVLMFAEHATRDSLPAERRSNPFELPRRRQATVPAFLPRNTLNSFCVRAFNALYYARHRDGRRIVDADRFFYPLDGVRRWNRLYGRRGFVQYQVLFPLETSKAGLLEVVETLSRSRAASFLAVLKRMGSRNEGLLSFSGPGHILSLDLPNTGARLRALLVELGRIVERYDGRLYLAKDATMSREEFARMYPRLEEFRATKQKLDPNGRFVSSQARRLGIAGP